ncbi:hypothetical protein QFZ20_005127 [Flavobacterium sp. W4I14]|nr:hypothetical protein [Flavobacterium sp. W4I14]
MKNKVNMDNFNYGVVELSEVEKLEIIGGDKFLNDIGWFFGKIANAFVNQHPDSGCAYCLDSVTLILIYLLPEKFPWQYFIH